MNATADTSASDSPRGKYHGCLSSPSIRRNDVLVTHRAAIVEAAKRRNFRGVALVGSVARGENASDSDVDFLVECDPERSTLFDLTGLVSDLRQLLGVDVDVVPKGYVRPSCRGMFENAIPL